MKSAALATSLIAASATLANAFTVSVDPASLTRVFDNFNDGVDTSSNHGNMAPAGETGGINSQSMPSAAADPQFHYPTPGAPFSSANYPYLRVNSRGTVGGASQIFPRPPAGPTVLGYATGTGFAESQLAFSAASPLPDGTGLRFDPLGGGTAITEVFDFDYVMLDRVRTIGLGEFDHDGALDGWTISANGHITGNSTSSSTSTFLATTSGVDPVMQRGGLNIDTNIYDTLEIRMAFDPASISRFEFFWGTNTFPGPTGGQSIAITSEIVRDGNLHTYRFDMSDEARWDGNLNLLRIDPLADADAAAGRTFEIDYIRLLDGAAIPEPSAGILALCSGLIFIRRRR
jgi:hypothetical protein